MTEPQLPESWKALLIEQRAAKIRQANALREAAKSLEMEAALILKLSRLDTDSKKEL